MAEKDTSNWGIYDWLDVAAYNRWRRRCPKCGGKDVKYGIHNTQTAGCELSVLCNDCKYHDSGNNSGEDAERLAREWHEQPNALGQEPCAAVCARSPTPECYTSLP